MSRVGNMPIVVPKGVAVTVADGTMRVKGPKGELSRPVPPHVSVRMGDQVASVERSGEHRQARAMHGLCRALLKNMITGVTEGFSRALEVNGVGYRADARSGVLALSLGYSHPIEVTLPKGVTARVEKNLITIESIDREQLGQLAAVVRAQRGPEPYKGKGVKYTTETIRRKEGKTGAA